MALSPKENVLEGYRQKEKGVISERAGDLSYFSISLFESIHIASG